MLKIMSNSSQYFETINSILKLIFIDKIDLKIRVNNELPAGKYHQYLKQKY